MMADRSFQYPSTPVQIPHSPRTPGSNETVGTVGTVGTIPSPGLATPGSTTPKRMPRSGSRRSLGPSSTSVWTLRKSQSMRSLSMRGPSNNVAKPDPYISSFQRRRSSLAKESNAHLSVLTPASKLSKSSSISGLSSIARGSGHRTLTSSKSTIGLSPYSNSFDHRDTHDSNYNGFSTGQYPLSGKTLTKSSSMNFHQTYTRGSYLPSRTLVNSKSIVGLNRYLREGNDGSGFQNNSQNYIEEESSDNLPLRAQHSFRQPSSKEIEVHDEQNHTRNDITRLRPGLHQKANHSSRSSLRPLPPVPNKSYNSSTYNDSRMISARTSNNAQPPAQIPLIAVLDENKASKRRRPSYDVNEAGDFIDSHESFDQKHLSTQNLENSHSFDKYLPSRYKRPKFEVTERKIKTIEEIASSTGKNLLNKSSGFFDASSISEVDDSDDNKENGHEFSTSLASIQSATRNESYSLSSADNSFANTSISTTLSFADTTTSELRPSYSFSRFLSKASSGLLGRPDKLPKAPSMIRGRRPKEEDEDIKLKRTQLLDSRRMEAEKKAREERERLERIERERREKEERERREREERERREREERERREREERERRERERLEKERLERERREREARKQLEQEQREKEEKERIEREKARVQQEKEQKEQKENEERERKEKELQAQASASEAVTAASSAVGTPTVAPASGESIGASASASAEPTPKPDFSFNFGGASINPPSSDLKPLDTKAGDDAGSKPAFSFKFGQSNKSTEGSPSPSLFGIGSDPVTTASTLAPTVPASSGIPSNDTSNLAKPTFSFGTSNTTSTTDNNVNNPSKPSGFSFGSNTNLSNSNKNDSKPAFNFSQPSAFGSKSPATTPSTFGASSKNAGFGSTPLNFGSTPQNNGFGTPTPGNNAFGSNPTSGATPFGTNTANSINAFGFSNSNNTNTANINTNNGGGFKFSTTPSFNFSSNNNSGGGGGFSFSNNGASSANAFSNTNNNGIGNNNPAPTPFSFGSTTNGMNSGFGNNATLNNGMNSQQSSGTISTPGGMFSFTPSGSQVPPGRKVLPLRRRLQR